MILKGFYVKCSCGKMHTASLDPYATCKCGVKIINITMATIVENDMKIERTK